MNEANFKNDDKKVLYYTGLPKWELFVALLMYIKPYLRETGLSCFQQLLLCLMRLRSKSTSSRSWIQVSNSSYNC